MKKQTKGLIGLSFAASMAVLLSGCGGGGGGIAGGSIQSYVGTSSPGDVWSWTFQSGTFSATNETLSHTYSGTSQDLPSGFKKLTITASNDSGVTEGSAGYAVEIPGEALLIKPAGGDSVHPIIATASTAPPQTDLNFNWVTVPRANWDYATLPAYGTTDLTYSSGAWTGTIHHQLLNGQPGSDEQGSLSYIDDRLHVNNSQAQAEMTPAGLMFIDNGPGNGGLVGMLQPASAIDWADFAGRQYRGLLVKAGKCQCVWAQSDGTGNMLGGGYAGDAGIETNTHDGDPQSGVAITLSSQPSNGLLRVNLTMPNGSASLVLAVNKVAGKYLAFGIGTDQQGGLYNIYLMEQ